MNKKYNVALLFELLTNRITENAVNKQGDKSLAYSKLMKKYFSKGKEMFKELKLYSNLCLEKHNLESDLLILNLINETINVASKIKPSLKVEIDSFFKDLSILENKDSFSFLNQKIDSNRYKLVNSVWSLFQESRNKFTFDSPKEKMNSLSTIHSYIKNKTNDREEEIALNSLNEIKNTQVTKYVYKHMFKKFNEDNKDKLNESQKALIDQVIRSKNVAQLKEWMLNEYKAINTSYRKLLTENKDVVVPFEKMEKAAEDSNKRCYKLQEIKISEFETNMVVELTALAMHQQVIGEMTSIINQ